MPGGEDPLEEEMATHSSVLAWKIPWTEEPGGLQSRGSQSDTTEHAHMRTLTVQVKRRNNCHARMHPCEVPEALWEVIAKHFIYDIEGNSTKNC